MTQSEEMSAEILEELIRVLRGTVANQQLEIADLKALLNVANSKLKEYETIED